MFRIPVAYTLFSAFFTCFLFAGEPTDDGKQVDAVCLDRSEAAKLVNKWFAQGTAAGNKGDYYDNRDRLHSSLRVKNFPQLSLHKYTPAELARRADWASTTAVRPYVTVGNSSTSAHPTRGGSNPRQMYTATGSIRQLCLQYRAGNVYVYPEHLDHDPGHNGRGGFGDLFPTNTPYLLISQGSSGSDRVFMNAFVLTLAAFRPEVKKLLIKKRLLMPTMQMIFRMSNRNITSPGHYLTGDAHPPVFEGKLIDLKAMVTRAQELQLKTIPPLVTLEVVAEDQPGRDYPHSWLGKTEVLSDTPHVIARIHRRLDYRKRIVLSAAKSADVNGLPLKFSWVILRGDKERIKITASDDGRQAEIVTAWHGRRPIRKNHQQETNRVDIGVFAFNGHNYSPPSFYTVFYMDDQRRTYSSSGKLLETWFGAQDTLIGYTSDKWPVIGDKYDIYDWNALFSLLQKPAGGLGARLFKSCFRNEELQAIADTADLFKSGYAAYISLRDANKEKRKLADAAVKESQARVSELKKSLAEVTKLQKENPSPETATELQQAKDALKAAEGELKQNRRKSSGLRKGESSAIWAAQKILEKSNDALGTGVKQFVEAALNTIKNNPLLYCDNAKEINALVQASPDKASRELFLSQQKELLELGLLKQKKDGSFGLHTVTPGTEAGKAPALHLTAYEKFSLRAFNLCIMNKFLFPSFLRCSPTTNYTDQRLSVPRPWRDTYRYGIKGELLGWSRTTGGEMSEYTSRGHRVVEKDKRGRPLKADQVNTILSVVFHDTKNKNKLVGRIESDGTSCTVLDAEGKKIIDSAGRGKGASPGQIQFLVFDVADPSGKAPLNYVIDLNHFDKARQQTGWTRFDKGNIYEFRREGNSNTFVGKDAQGKRIPDRKLRYQVPKSKVEVKFVPAGKTFRYTYQSELDMVGKAVEIK